MRTSCLSQSIHIFAIFCLAPRSVIHFHLKLESEFSSSIHLLIISYFSKILIIEPTFISLLNPHSFAIVE